MNTNNSLLSLLPEHKKNIFFGVIGLTVVDGIMLLVPIIIGDIVTKLSEPNSSEILTSSINKATAYLFLCGLVMAIFRFVWRYFLMGTARRIEKKMREKYFEKLQNLPMLFFNDSDGGDLMTRGVNDIENIKMACGFGIVLVYDGIVLLAFIFISMFIISSEFTLYAAIPFVLMGFLILRYGDYIQKLFLEVQNSFSRLTEEARKIIFSIRAIKSVNDEDNQISRFSKVSKSYEVENLNLIKIWAGYQPLITFFTGISILVLIFLGSNMVYDNEISLGDFSSLMVYLTMLSWPVIAMGMAVDFLKRGNASLTRVNQVILEDSEQDESALKSIEKIKTIKFKKINFSYTNENFIQDLSLDINQAESIGITGKTGSGKSTICKLIMKLIKADNIFLNDTKIDDINKHSIRSQISYIEQEPIIFTGTIKENVSFFDKNPQEEKVINCLKSAGFSKDLLNMPKGLNTIVGERGLSLSGGQRQRLSLARALYQDPSVLILDDNLSSLDVETELLILENLKREFKDKILIVISSRISTIFSFDKIAVFDSGNIVQFGNSVLLEKESGLFKDLMKIQKILPNESEDNV